MPTDKLYLFLNEVYLNPLFYVSFLLTVLGLHNFKNQPKLQ